MKRFITTIAIVLTLGVVGYQVAGAAPGWGRGYGPGGCGGYGSGMMGNSWATPDEKAFEAREKFLDETKELRKQIVTKQAELSALYNNDDARVKDVATLRSELFDLQNDMRKQAVEKDIVAYGPDFCFGPGGGYGYGASKSGFRKGRGFGWRANQI